jgi:hypothetical protein
MFATKSSVKNSVSGQFKLGGWADAIRILSNRNVALWPRLPASAMQQWA